MRSDASGFESVFLLQGSQSSSASAHSIPVHTGMRWLPMLHGGLVGGMAWVVSPSIQPACSPSVTCQSVPIGPHRHLVPYIYMHMHVGIINLFPFVPSISIHPSIYSFTSVILSRHLSTYLHLSIHPSTYPSGSLSICLSIHLSIYLLVHLSTHPPIHLSTYQSIYPYI